MRVGVCSAINSQSDSRFVLSQESVVWNNEVFVAETSHFARKKIGGSVSESNRPETSKTPLAGFEDQKDHRILCASALG
jgi:hypothetical protein